MSDSNSKKGTKGAGGERYPRPVPARRSQTAPAARAEWVGPANPVDLDKPEAITRFVETEKALELQARREAREEYADARTEVVRAKSELVQAEANRVNGVAARQNAAAALMRFDRVERIVFLIVNVALAVLLMAGVVLGADFLGRAVAAAAAFNALMAGFRAVRTWSSRRSQPEVEGQSEQVPPPQARTFPHGDEGSS